MIKKLNQMINFNNLRSDECKEISDSDNLSWDLTMRPQHNPYTSSKSGTVKNETETASSNVQKETTSKSSHVNGDFKMGYINLIESKLEEQRISNVQKPPKDQSSSSKRDNNKIGSSEYPSHHSHLEKTERSRNVHSSSGGGGSGGGVGKDQQNLKSGYTPYHDKYSEKPDTEYPKVFYYSSDRRLERESDIIPVLKETSMPKNRSSLCTTLLMNPVFQDVSIIYFPNLEQNSIKNFLF